MYIYVLQVDCVVFCNCISLFSIWYSYFTAILLVCALLEDLLRFRPLVAWGSVSSSVQTLKFCLSFQNYDIKELNIFKILKYMGKEIHSKLYFENTENTRTAVAMRKDTCRQMLGRQFRSWPDGRFLLQSSCDTGLFHCIIHLSPRSELAPAIICCRSRSDPRFAFRPQVQHASLLRTKSFNAHILGLIWSFSLSLWLLTDQ